MFFHVIFNLDSPYDKLYQEVCPAYTGSPTPSCPIAETIYLCDRDTSIRKYTRRGYPVIAVSHAGNHAENLMGTPWLILSPDALTKDLLQEVFCRHRGIPLLITQTCRCCLRELSPEDFPALLTLQEENAQNPDGCFFPSPCEAPQEFLQDYIDHQYPFFGYGQYAVLHQSSGAFLGICGFCSVFPVLEAGDEVSAAEVSYAFLQKWQHQGYAKEALEGLLAWGREKGGYEHFRAHIHPSNVASIALAKQCGIQIYF